MAVFDLGRHKERLLEKKTDWDEAAGCLEGLSREQRGVVFACYDRGSQGLPSLVGASPLVACRLQQE